MANISRATLDEIHSAEMASIECIHAYGKIIDNLQASKRLQASVNDQATDSRVRSQFERHIADTAVQVAGQACDLFQKIEIEYHYEKQITSAAHRQIMRARLASGAKEFRVQIDKGQVFTEDAYTTRSAHHAADILARLIVKCVIDGSHQSDWWKQAAKPFIEAMKTHLRKHPHGGPPHIKFEEPEPSLFEAILYGYDEVLENFAAYYEVWPDADAVEDAIREEAANAASHAPQQMPQQIEWTKPALPSYWASVFECDVRTLRAMIERGTIVGEIMTTKRWRIGIDSLPAKEKSRHRGAK
jgi:head-tail adaptor